MLGIILLLFLISKLQPIFAETPTGLNIDIYVAKDIPVVRDGFVMKSWIEEGHARDLVNCLNNIYERGIATAHLSGGIKFSLKHFHRIHISHESQSAKLGLALESLLGATKESTKNLRKMRRQVLLNIFGSEIIESNDRSSVINIYVVPFLGDNFQGSATFSRRIPYRKDIILTDWTNRRSTDGIPRKRNLLPLPKVNSLCKTLGHEIGHVLNLTHHNEPKLAKYLMVGGWGTLLKRVEAELAIKTARILAK